MKRPPRIIAVTGYGLGAGKSISLTALGYMAHLSGLNVWSNIKQNYPYKYLWGPEQLEQALEDQTLRDSMIIFDDINTLIDSRRGTARVNLLATYFAQQARKRNLIFIFSCPLLIWTDVRLSDLADLVIYCRFHEEREAVGWTIYDYRQFPPAVSNLELSAPFFYGLYDTEEIVTPETLRRK